MMILKKKASASASEPQIIEAKDAGLGVHYKTTGKPPVRVICKGRTIKGDEVLLDAYHVTYQEWNPVTVPLNYKLITLKEGEIMPTATTKKAVGSKNSTKAVGAISGKSVYPTWGMLFKKHGTAPDAAKLIAAGMAKEFPGRKTDWAKWVNSVRTLYNRGDAKLEVVKPATPLKPFAINGAAKPKSKVASKPPVKAAA